MRLIFLSVCSFPYIKLICFDVSAFAFIFVSLIFTFSKIILKSPWHIEILCQLIIETTLMGLFVQLKHAFNVQFIKIKKPTQA